MPTATDTPAMTVPEFARAEGIALDRLRKLFRRRRDLAALLPTVGPTRVVPPEAADAIRAALRESGRAGDTTR